MNDFNNFSSPLFHRVTLNSRDPITRLGISSSPNNPKKTIKSFPLGLVQSASQNLQPNARNLQDVYVNISDKIRRNILITDSFSLKQIKFIMARCSTAIVH